MADEPRPHGGLDELGQREKDVLRAVVQEYIGNGGPVGSAQLARRPEFDVSTATLRNVLSDLEALGYLQKPHTSAGRVPTDRAYRFFVDSMMRLREPGQKERELIRQGISANSPVEDALQEASRVLHFLSHHAAMVFTPRPAAAVFHRIELVRLREDRVLAILIDRSGQVQNRPFTIDFPLTSEELVRASNLLTELLQEVPLEDVHARLGEELAREQAMYDRLREKALRLGHAATDHPASERVHIEGKDSFFDAPEFSDLERMRSLFRALEEKHRLVAILDRVQRAREMQIFIGAESELSSVGGVSVIASPYGVGDQVLGAVGVIGPTRMNYQRVIPLVRFTAGTLSHVLSE